MHVRSLHDHYFKLAQGILQNFLDGHFQGNLKSLGAPKNKKCVSLVSELPISNSASKWTCVLCNETFSSSSKCIAWAVYWECEVRLTLVVAEVVFTLTWSDSALYHSAFGENLLQYLSRQLRREIILVPQWYVLMAWFPRSQQERQFEMFAECLAIQQTNDWNAATAIIAELKRWMWR